MSRALIVPTYDKAVVHWGLTNGASGCQVRWLFDVRQHAARNTGPLWVSPAVSLETNMASDLFKSPRLMQCAALYIIPYDRHIQ